MCQYTNKCWRYVYTQYFKKYPETIDKPPTRHALMLDGYASIEIYPDKGIPAKTLAQCPFDAGIEFDDCPEKKSQDRRIRHTAEFRVYRPSIPKEVRCSIARKYKFTCVYCGKNTNSIDPDTGKKLGGVIDHFKPLALQGKHEESNFVYACRKCNGEKADKIWELGCKIKANI